jgi:hypothetical protein
MDGITVSLDCEGGAALFLFLGDYNPEGSSPAEAYI